MGLNTVPDRDIGDHIWKCRASTFPLPSFPEVTLHAPMGSNDGLV